MDYAPYPPGNEQDRFDIVPSSTMGMDAYIK